MICAAAAHGSLCLDNLTFTRVFELFLEMRRGSNTFLSTQSYKYEL